MLFHAKVNCTESIYGMRFENSSLRLWWLRDMMEKQPGTVKVYLCSAFEPRANQLGANNGDG